ncbi:ABC transporter permease [Geodermatophilus sp. FMUSA9-8]|uniref:ABC transporter permease n=1 Tax=Geodermatophilus sp. FMUSA9-8 TaxID=3120155 RepID=UPI00300A6B98
MSITSHVTPAGTATAAEIPPSTGSRPMSADARVVTLPRVVHSEWIKLRSLHSTWSILAAAVAGMLIFGAVVAINTRTGGALEAEDAALSGTLQGYLLAELLIGVLGVLFVSAEYGTGMIRSTLAVVPRRWPVPLAKAVVLAGLVLATMTTASLATFLGAQVVLGADGHSLTDPGAVRVVFGTAVYLTLIGLLGSAMGWLLRNTAAGIAVLTGLLLVAPVLTQTLLGAFGRTIAPYLPSLAGQSLAVSDSGADALSPTVGSAVLVGWIGIALVAAIIRLTRRDA